MRRLLLAILLVCVARSAFAQTPGMPPDFCPTPDRTADASGNWTTAANWDANTLPVAGDVIVIPSGISITYDAATSTEYGVICVESGGTLTFSTSMTTELHVTTISVESGGTFTIASEGSPLSSSYTATIVFNDEAIDTTADPEQFGHGLVCDSGTCKFYGATKTAFLRLAAEVSAGAGSITLPSIPAGWLSGDEIVLPESIQRAYGSTSSPQASPLVKWDDREVLSGNVSTTTASFSGTTSYAHPGGKDGNGTVTFYPHAANTTRNIIFKSENAAGVRGHSMYMHTADVDIRYVQFKDMGRTTVADLHCTLFASGSVQGQADCLAGTGLPVSQVGTNQKGRYAVHFHHLWGPTNVGQTGYQFRFVGNAVVDSTKWPIALHLASYGLVQSNVCAYYQASCIFFEEWGEHFNTVDSNICIGAVSDVKPRGEDDNQAGLNSNDTGAGGREPACIWGHGGQNNYITNNVAASFWSTSIPEILNEVGFKFHVHAAGNTARVPDFMGADLTDAMEYTTAEAQDQPILEFSGNECYAMSTCLTAWFIGSDGGSLTAGMGESLVQNLNCWNLWEQCWFGYPVNNWRFSGVTCRGLATNTVSIPRGYFPYCWTSGDYKNANITIQNLDAQGVGHGITDTFGIDVGLTISGLTTRTVGAGVSITGYYVPGAGAPPVGSSVNISIANWTHTPLSGYGDVSLKMWFNPYGVAVTDPLFYADTLDSTPVTVTNYSGSGGSGLSFQAYFEEQITDAYAGGLAPCSDTTTLPEVDGVVCSITTGLAPRFRFRQRVSADRESLWASVFGGTTRPPALSRAVRASWAPGRDATRRPVSAAQSTSGRQSGSRSPRWRRSTAPTETRNAPTGRHPAAAPRG